MTIATSETPEKRPFWDRFSDRINPILVKETRQALKGRGFVATFGLLLTSCWMISFIGSLSAGLSLEYYAFAMQFFAFYFIPLAAAIGVVVPFLAYTSMLNERMDDTFEMLSITTLNARRIVNGKLTSSVVQILLFYSAITPFIAFTSLLQGFQLLPVTFVMVLSFFLSIFLCALGLLISTLAQNRIIQGFFSLIFVAFLLFCFSFSFAVADGTEGMSVGSAFFWSLGGVVLLLSALTLLIREITVAQITFESDNRSSGIRLVSTVLLVVFWIFLPIVSSVTSMPSRAWPSIIGLWIMVSCAVMAPVTLFICTEPVELSRRVRKQVQSVADSAGILAFPFLPGCARGYVYVVIHLVPMLGIFIIARAAAPLGDATLYIGFFCILYLLVYAGMATFLSQIIRQLSPSARAAHVRSTFLIVISVAAIAPHLIVELLETNRFGRVEYTPLLLTSPFATFYYLTDVPPGWDNGLYGVALVLALIALIMLVFNLGAIGRSMSETFSHTKAPEKTPARRIPAADAAAGPVSTERGGADNRQIDQNQMGADA